MSQSIGLSVVALFFVGSLAHANCFNFGSGSLSPEQAYALAGAAITRVDYTACTTIELRQAEAALMQFGALQSSEVVKTDAVAKVTASIYLANTKASLALVKLELAARMAPKK